MKLELKRLKFGEDYTIGRLSLDGRFLCYTLEDKVREVIGEPVSNWKVQNQTAIPVGVYPVIITMSARFKVRLPLLMDVPGFSGIRIHTGNSSKDTEGCILVGVKDDNNEGKVLMSRVTFDGVFGRIEKALLRSEKVTIEIV